MPTDDLNTPLGQHKPARKPKFRLAMPQILAGIFGLFGLIVVSWAIFVKDPLGGEPVAYVATNPPADAAARTAAAGDGKEHSRYDGPEPASPDARAAADAAKAAAGKAPPPPGSKVITIIDGSSGKSQEVVIPGNSSSLPAKPAADPKLQETTRHGVIPKIAADGARASTVYAQPRELPADLKGAPRIAIVIGGIGISASGTADALTKLPAPVTLAIAPYGADLQKLAERARAEKHEVLLQVPMEPFDFPDNDPGPQTLLTSLSADQNIDRLHWLMSRFEGYVGIAGYMGARFTSTEAAISPVLRDTARRGLIYLDDGASPRSVVGQIANSSNLPYAKADVVLDATPTAVEIDRALTRLEMAARENGAAIGVATAQPAAIARIADWARKVESRGFVLVPISMVAARAKSS